MSEVAIHSCSLQPHKPNSSHAFATLGGSLLSSSLHLWFFLGTLHSLFRSLLPWVSHAGAPTCPQTPSSPRALAYPKILRLLHAAAPINLIAPLFSQRRFPHLHCTWSRALELSGLKINMSCTISNKFSHPINYLASTCLYKKGTWWGRDGGRAWKERGC